MLVLNRTAELFRYDTGLWTGVLVYSIVNVLMNAVRISQDKILTYDCIIAVVAILGVIIDTIFYIYKVREKPQP